MFSKLFFWAFVAFIAMLACSKINLETSIYKEEQNSLEIIFPQWKTEQPWFYFYWTPGTVKWQQDPVEEKADESTPSLPAL